MCKGVKRWYERKKKRRNAQVCVNETFVCANKTYMYAKETHINAKET